MKTARRGPGHCLVVIVIVAAVGLTPPLLWGQQVSLPPVDLGATSFMDGVGGPGVFLQEILGPYHASKFTGAAGQTLPGSNTLTAMGTITELAYTSSKFRLLGGYYCTELLIPLAHVDVRTDLGIRGSDGGLGDIIYAPLMVQWPEHKIFGKTIFQRFDADLIFPTGEYSHNRPVNLGNNLFSFNPNYSITLFLMPKLETTWRLHYLWNSRNSDPSPVYNAGSIQPGQATHFNASVSYLLRPKLRLGVAGYYLKEVTDPKIGRVSTINQRELIGAIGPGLWVAAKPLEIYAHAFIEMGAENRPQGVRFMVRLVKVFPKKQQSRK